MMPTVWLEGSQLTGYATDDAPVLAGLSLDWGADNDIEHQGPAELSFSILFRDGVMDMADFRRGAELEIMVRNRTVFAGTVRSATALPDKRGITVTGKCIEHLATLESIFLQTEWLYEISAVRWGTLQGAFDEKGFDLLPRTRSHPYHEATSYYSSIKLITLLDRYLAADGRLTRWDASQRVDGVLTKRIGTGARGASSGANKLATDGSTWIVEYTTTVNTGVITWIEAGNVLASGWTLEPGTAITSVNLSTQVTETDEDGTTVTNLVESVRNDTGSIAVHGVNSVEVTSSASAVDGDWRASIAETWYRPDTGWTLDQAQLRDTDEIAVDRMLRLLDTRLRSQNLVIIRGIRAYTPNQGAGNLRASLIGGTYTWTGKAWEMSLKLGRNQAFAAPNQYSFADLRSHTSPAVADGTAASVGKQISFADFKQITKETPHGNT